MPALRQKETSQRGALRHVSQAAQRHHQSAERRARRSRIMRLVRQPKHIRLSYLRRLPREIQCTAPGAPERKLKPDVLLLFLALLAAFAAAWWLEGDIHKSKD